jgi:hypothetical protein
MLVVLLVTSLPPVLVFVGGVGSVSTPFLLPQLPMAAVRRWGYVCAGGVVIAEGV